MRMLVIGAHFLGVNALFYFLNRHAKRILCFHNVLPDELFRPDLGGDAVMRLSEFRQIVTECKKIFPITTNVLDAKSLTLTFDDGYRNQYTVAYKCLKELGVVGCVFVSGQRDDPLVIDKIVHWNLLSPIEIVGDRSKSWNELIWPVYQQDWKGRGQKAVEFCNQRYPVESAFNQMSPEYRAQRFGYITDEELDEMRHDGWLVGWHTKSHYPLAYLPSNELDDELTPPDKRMLSVCFSYPYGVESHVGLDAIKRVGGGVSLCGI